MTEVVNAFVDGPDLVVIERADGRLIERKQRAEYSFFVETSELDDELARSLRSSRSVRAVVPEGRFTRLIWADDWIRRTMVSGRKDGERRIPSPFQERGIKTYDGDIDPVRRYFTDTRANVAKPARAYFDIESDSRCTFVEARAGAARILSLALTDEAEDRTWVAVLSEWTDAAERRLIQEFFDKITQWGFDQLLAWNGDGFDFEVLRARVDRLGMQVDMRRKLWLDHMVLFRRMNLNSSDSGEEKQSMALGSICQAHIGEGKEEIPDDVAARWPGRSLGSLAYELWEAGGTFRELLGRYNLKDTILMARLERHTGYVALFDTLADVCRVLPDSRGLLPTQQADGFMLVLALERDFKFPTREFREGMERPEQYAGAFVMEPSSLGILKDVHVADFASLYPSIIISLNMSPETKRSIPINGPIPAGHCRSPLTGIGFTTEFQGILPAACVTAIAMRKKWSDLAASLPPGTPEAKDAQRRSMAYKVWVNSFYGVVGSPYGRYYDRQVAESVTQTGVWLIKRTIFEATERGMDVFYGDTDSFFARRFAQEAFGEFCSWCNADLYPRILAEIGCNLEWNRIKLAYEKAFAILLMIGKKRYAGLFDHYKGSKAKPMPAEGEEFDKKRHSKPEIKGLEYKRGDSITLARRLQERVIMTAMRGVESPAPYRKLVDEMLAYIQTADLPVSEVQQSKSLSKAPKDYHRKTPTGKDAAVPPHVKVAEAMAKAGKEIGEGARVFYVVMDGSDGIEAISAADYVGELDRYYLWDNLIYPPTMRVLQTAFPDQDWVEGLERTRPRKARASTMKAEAAGQGTLFAADRSVEKAVARVTTKHRGMIEALAGVQNPEPSISNGRDEAAAFDDAMTEAVTRSFEWEVMRWRA
jgi:DNA polymerase I